MDLAGRGCRCCGVRRTGVAWGRMRLAREDDGMMRRPGGGPALRGIDDDGEAAALFDIDRGVVDDLSSFGLEHAGGEFIDHHIVMGGHDDGRVVIPGDLEE